MKRPIAILIGLAMLASAGAVLARDNGGQGAFGGRHSGVQPRHQVGQPGVQHGQHHRRPIVIVSPGWGHHGHHRHHHHHHSSAFVVTAPFFYPVYTPIPVPVYVEQRSEVLYYCPDYRDYYPNVATCPSQWMQVIPRAAGTTY